MIGTTRIVLLTRYIPEQVSRKAKQLLAYEHIQSEEGCIAKKLFYIFGGSEFRSDSKITPSFRNITMGAERSASCSSDTWKHTLRPFPSMHDYCGDGDEISSN
jgi:hypothetical protein